MTYLERIYGLLSGSNLTEEECDKVKNEVDSIIISRNNEYILESVIEQNIIAKMKESGLYNKLIGLISETLSRELKEPQDDDIVANESIAY